MYKTSVNKTTWPLYIDDLLQERRNSSALAMELRLFALTHRYVNVV